MWAATCGRPRATGYASSRRVLAGPRPPGYGLGRRPGRRLLVTVCVTVGMSGLGTLAPGVTVGPILLGAAKPVHILTPTATVRRMVNMTALCVVDANAQQRALF